MNPLRSVKEWCHPNMFGAAEIRPNVPCPAHRVRSAINNAHKHYAKYSCLFQVLATLLKVQTSIRMLADSSSSTLQQNSATSLRVQSCPPDALVRLEKPSNCTKTSRASSPHGSVEDCGTAQVIVNGHEQQNSIKAQQLQASTHYNVSKVSLQNHTCCNPNLGTM